MQKIIKNTLVKAIPKQIRRIKRLHAESAENKRLKEKIISYLKENTIEGTSEIIHYLETHELGVFNYRWADKHIYKVHSIKLDKNTGLYYAILNGKRMYFKRGMSKESCNAYLNSLLLEQDDCSPHNYLTQNELKTFTARTVIDCGAAEGIFGLYVLDKVNELIMFEADKAWIEALRYTFKGCSNVTIVPKFVGKDTTDTTISIDDYLHERRDIDYIKMDIEDMECEALIGARETLVNNTQLTVAACVYHSHDEEARVCQVMNGYKMYTKPGYMVYLYDPNGLEEPYLRHGVIIFKK